MFEIVKIDIHKITQSRQGEAYRNSSHLYVGIQNESIMENLTFGRHNRPHKAYETHLLPLLAERGINVTQAFWSKNAGCSMCPCSPGFILPLAPANTDYHVTITHSSNSAAVVAEIKDPVHKVPLL